MAEIEETIGRIKSNNRVGYIITNKEKKMIRSSYTNNNTQKDSLLNSMPSLTEKAINIIRDLDPSNDLTFLRIKTKVNEIMVGNDKDFYLITLQEDEYKGDQKN